MVASQHLNFDLFHGTGGEIRGGVINPGHRNALSEGAYATDSLFKASHYAVEKAKEQGRLFGTVYKVKPLSNELDSLEYWNDLTVVDPKGLKVDDAVHYPVNESAVHEQRGYWNYG